MMQDIPTGRELKLANRNNIYKLVWRERRISKQGIMQKLGISLPTVTQNLNELCEQGLVITNGTFRYTGGRSAAGYSIVQNARLAVGVDLNKTHISVVIMDLYGDILQSHHEHCGFENKTEYYKRVAGHVASLMKKANVTKEKLLGIGISMQGLVSQDHKKVIYGPILGTTGVQVEQVAEFIPFPCELFHDADSAAFAELWVSLDVCNAVYVSLSTNLGGSLIINRGIFGGDNYMAGKLEHMTLVPDGEKCYCGEKGCAEVYCRASNISDFTPDGELRTFFNLLEAGDKKAIKIWDAYLDHLVILLNNLHMFMDTDIILGGYMAVHLNPYLEDLKQRAYIHNSVDKKQDYIHLGCFTEEAIAAGSALHYIDHFVNNV
jgi:predicted NBD/HSP70 family sugar kinase